MGILTYPQTWQEVADFITANGLDQDEYFTLDERRVQLTQPVWTPDTWRIAIWLCEGGNEGYYLHVDEFPVLIENGQRKEGKRKPRALGKFWSVEAAMHAQLLLWHYINGHPLRLQIAALPKPEEEAIVE